METKTTLDLNGSLAIAGGLLAGLGAAFFLLETSALFFVGSLLGGLGLGMILSSFVGRKQVIEKSSKKTN